MTARTVALLVRLTQMAQPLAEPFHYQRRVSGLSLRHCTTFKPSSKQKRAPV
jgi:hypothetical protein